MIQSVDVAHHSTLTGFPLCHAADFAEQDPIDA
jgi:hypothetical protein